MEELYSIYYNPKSGLLSPYKLYLKLKKKVPLRKIEEFVKKQEVWQTKQPRIKPQFNHIHVYSRNHLWQIDLVDFSKFSHWNRGYKYLLCAIDVYSRKSFVVPLKRKSDAHLGMGIILMKTKPVLIQSDNGTEFISKEFQHVLDKHDVRHVTVIAGDHNRQSIVERFNRTLESMIARYQNSRNTNKYIDVLEDIVHNYNHTFHQSIQDIPERKFLMNPNSGVVLTNHFKFPNDIQVGDYVRILKEKKQFQKGYADNFSRQIYHVIQGNGYTFSLQDENGHGLNRKYKYYELSKVTNVEKYLNRQADREKPLTNQQKRNRREIEELLEHTVEPLQKKRKIISRNLFS